jgi:dehydratase
MRKFVRPIGLMSLAGGLAVAATMALMPAANAAATVPVNLDCQGRPPIGAPQQIALDATIQATAPETVAPGGTFEVVIAPDPMQVPSDAAGNKVNNLRDLLMRVPVPAGSTVESVSLTGGSNLGTGTPTATPVGDLISVLVPGPLAGGSTIQLPALHMNLKATGEPGSTIVTKLAGTSYDDPGLGFTANVRAVFFDVDVPTSCFPNPSPTFTTTTITA